MAGVCLSVLLLPGFSVMYCVMNFTVVPVEEDLLWSLCWCASCVVLGWQDGTVVMCVSGVTEMVCSLASRAKTSSSSRIREHSLAQLIASGCLRVCSGRPLAP